MNNIPFDNTTIRWASLHSAVDALLTTTPVTLDEIIKRLSEKMPDPAAPKPQLSMVSPFRGAFLLQEFGTPHSELGMYRWHKHIDDKTCLWISMTSTCIDHDPLTDRPAKFILKRTVGDGKAQEYLSAFVDALKKKESLWLQKNPIYIHKTTLTLHNFTTDFFHQELGSPAESQLRSRTETWKLNVAGGYLSIRCRALETGVQTEVRFLLRTTKSTGVQDLAEFVAKLKLPTETKQKEASPEVERVSAVSDPAIPGEPIQAQKESKEIHVIMSVRYFRDRGNPTWYNRNGDDWEWTGFEGDLKDIVVRLAGPPVPNKCDDTPRDFRVSHLRGDFQAAKKSAEYFKQGLEMEKFIVSLVSEIRDNSETQDLFMRLALSVAAGPNDLIPTFRSDLREVLALALMRSKTK